MVKIRSEVSENLGCSGRLVLTVFLGLFFLAGSLFTAMVAREFVRAVKTRTWKKTECVVVSSGVREDSGRDENPYVFEVAYKYDFGGTEYTSEDYSTKRVSFSDYSKAQRLKLKYAPDSKATCFVNPSRPQQAILHHQSLAVGFVIFFPLIFVAIGLGGIYFVWFGKGKEESEEKPKSISERAKMASGRGVAWIVFGMFFIIGSILSYFFLVRPAILVFKAKGWRETPCVVVSSSVRTIQDDEGNTYKVDILYEYEVAGRKYRSNRYHFLGGSSSGRSGKAEIVRRHPRGKKTVAYVDPKDPTEAVLQRAFTPAMLIGLFPLAFMLIGGGGLIYLIRNPKKKATPGTRWMPESVRPAAGSAVAVGGPTTLEAKSSRYVKLIVVIAVAAFWNGVVSILFYQVVESWQKGHPNWFLTLFAIPFVLVGMGLIFGIGYCLLAVFNPWPKLKLSSGSVPLGGSADVEWEMKGRSANLSRLRIYLEGHEEAEYRRGTRTYTDKETFADIEIANTTGRIEMLMGRGRFTVPANTMHSFGASHNKIIWKIKVHGEVAWWPDVNEEFDFAVLPVDSGQGGQR